MSDAEIDRILLCHGMFPNPDARTCMRDMAAHALEKQAREMVESNDAGNKCTVHDAAKHLRSVAAHEYRSAGDEG